MPRPRQVGDRPPFVTIEADAHGAVVEESHPVRALGKARSPNVGGETGVGVDECDEARCERDDAPRAIAERPTKAGEEWGVAPHE